MILATTTVENVDRFLDVFGTKGAEKRALHGSKGSTVFRDPTEENRVWARFDWDAAGWAQFVSDPEVPPFLEQLHRAGFTRRGGHIVCTYFDENFLNLVPADRVEGLYGCLDYYRDVNDPFSIDLLNRYEQLYPGSAMFTAGSACTGTYRAVKLWEAAVLEASSLNQDDVIIALDHARIAHGPGGPAEMVPGQHHVRMNMYIARSQGGAFKVVRNLGHIDPKECEVQGASH